MRKQQVEPLTKEEMASLMAVIEETDEFDYMLFTILKNTGRRIGELCGIEELKQIGRKKIGERIIYVNNQQMKIDRTIPVYKKTGKKIYGVKVKDIDFDLGSENKKPKMKVWVLKRRKYMQDETVLGSISARLIWSYIRKNRLNLEDYVFRRKGRTVRALQNRIKMYAKKAGIDHPVVIHNFRHYFITHLKRKGWSNDKIAKLTGHKSSATLAIYDHVVAEDIRDDALDALKDL